MSTRAVTELNVKDKQIVAGIGQYYKHLSEVRLTVIDVGWRPIRIADVVKVEATLSQSWLKRESPLA